MKKKMKEHEDVVRRDHNNTIDNKETTGMSDNSGFENADYSSDNESEKDSADNRAKSEGKTDNMILEVRVVEEKLAEMQDRYIRLSAEFDNYRKRTLREKMDLSKYASENLLLSILPLMDDFERALQHIDTSSDTVSLKNGIDLIYSKFCEFLKQNSVKEIESMNTTFNVDIHEAVAKMPVEEEDRKGKVVDVLLKGYYLQDKVLRFAKVVVGQ
jgi:molecular chaperone GrpE